MLILFIALLKKSIAKQHISKMFKRINTFFQRNYINWLLYVVLKMNTSPEWLLH